ncbi:MAG: hypothetical protein PHC61_09275, partial [Chitinivibrionales bacterium]|nr:hypothetical protein [Chitinivibrionales bacterium]
KMQCGISVQPTLVYFYGPLADAQEAGVLICGIKPFWYNVGYNLNNSFLQKYQKQRLRLFGKPGLTRHTNLECTLRALNTYTNYTSYDGAILLDWRCLPGLAIAPLACASYASRSSKTFALGLRQTLSCYQKTETILRIEVPVISSVNQGYYIGLNASYSL